MPHHSQLELSGVVIDVVPLCRSGGKKRFEVGIEDPGSVEKKADLDRTLPKIGRSQDEPCQVDVSRVCVVFWDEWAHACSFMGVGDVLTVHNFDVESGASAKARTDQPFTVVCTQDSEVTVHRQRTVRINAKNVDAFEYSDGPVEQSDGRQGGPGEKESYGIAKLKGHNRFTRMGQYYDAIYGTNNFKPQFDFVLSLLNSNFARKCLDLGCGSGLYSFYLAHHDMSCVGVDDSEALLRVAAEKGSLMGSNQQVEFFQQDMSELNLLQTVAGQEVSQVFDAIICVDSLQLLPSIEHIQMTLRRCWYHLKQEGLLLIDIPNQSNADLYTTQQAITSHRIAYENMSSLGNGLHMDEGTLDVVRRGFTDKGKRVHEWSGFAKQQSKQRKQQYFTNWNERVEELLFSPSEMDSLLATEGFQVSDVFGDLLGSELDTRSSPRRVYLAKRTSRSSSLDLQVG